jgi:hypothetical protein
MRTTGYIIAACILLMAGCEVVPSEPVETPIVPVPDLNYPSAVAISPGSGTTAQCRQVTLTAQTQPEARPGSFIWTSSNPRVLAVDSAGVVTTLRAGQAIVTARWAADTTVRGTHTQTVVEQAIPNMAVQAFRARGSQTYMLFNELSGEVEVVMNVRHHGPDNGVLQVVIDSTIIATAPYPGGCPYLPDTTVSITPAFNTAAFTAGPHDLRAWVLTPDGQKVHAIWQPMVFVR